MFDIIFEADLWAVKLLYQSHLSFERALANPIHTTALEVDELSSAGCNVRHDSTQSAWCFRWSSG